MVNMITKMMVRVFVIMLVSQSRVLWIGYCCYDHTHHCCQGCCSQYFSILLR